MMLCQYQNILRYNEELPKILKAVDLSKVFSGCFSVCKHEDNYMG